MDKIDILIKMTHLIQQVIHIKNQKVKVVKVVKAAKATKVAKATNEIMIVIKRMIIFKIRVVKKERVKDHQMMIIKI